MSVLRAVGALVLIVWLGVLAVSNIAQLQPTEPPVIVRVLTHGWSRTDSFWVDARSNLAYRRSQLLPSPQADPLRQPDYTFDSPDGTLRATTRYNDSSRKYDLYLTDANGEEQHLANFVNTTVLWAPNGDYLYYFVFRLAGTEIDLWAYDLATDSGEVLLPNFGAWLDCSPIDPAWCWIGSPRNLVYAIVNLNTRTTVSLDAHDYGLSPVWAHTIPRLAFGAVGAEGTSELYLYDTTSDQVETLAALPNPLDSFRFLSWSHDEQWIAAPTTRGSRPHGLVLMSTQQPILIDVTPYADPMRCFIPRSWSPDSTMLLIEASTTCRNRSGDLYAFSIAHKTLTQVTHGTGNQRFSAAWAPDSTGIAVLAEDVANGYLQRVQVSVYDSDYKLLHTRDLPLERNVEWSDAAVGWQEDNTLFQP